MPPRKTGIADYSEALAAELATLASLEVFEEAPAQFQPERYDVIVYQLGNNEHHEFVYRMALQYPGVVVLHEFNLHYLVADITVKRGDWEAYFREVAYEGGPAALERAQRARAGLANLDYHGLPMVRRVLEKARGVIVHSQYMVERVRQAGFRGPVARIPHGAWIPRANRMGYRYRLGLDEQTPLIGIFGFLKPYKRIPETLRAFRRLLRFEPRAKLILVGEPHPELPLEPLIDSLGLSAAVRLLGYVPIEEFTGYMAACDIIVNLRWPTVGETSGTLLRAMGLGKPVLVSEVGAFAEFPEGLCLKVPCGTAEEDVIFEYLNLLVCRPDVAREIGRRAQRWVEEECNWSRVARLYMEFLEALVQNSFTIERRITVERPTTAELRAIENGKDALGSQPASALQQPTIQSAIEPLAGHGGKGLQTDPSIERAVLSTDAAGTSSKDSFSALTSSGHPPEESTADASEECLSNPVVQRYVALLKPWLEADQNPGAQQYIAAHLDRLCRTLELIPRGSPSDRILELGTYLHITPLLHYELGYGDVRGAYYGPAGIQEKKSVRSTTGMEFHCLIDLFDAEYDPFPYPDNYFTTVLCCEILEHLHHDPMHMMAEINRVLRPGGHLVLTTPNLASLRAVAALLEGYHPGLFPAYLKPAAGTEPGARHHREYTAKEVIWLLWDAGFEVVRLETGPFRQSPRPDLLWVEHLLERYGLPAEHRGDGIYALARKSGPVKRRYPEWLYS